MAINTLDSKQFARMMVRARQLVQANADVYYQLQTEYNTDPATALHVYGETVGFPQREIELMVSD